MNITEKMAYVKGLFEGLDFDVNTKEGKLLSAMMDLLDDMALSVADLEDECAAINEVLDEIDEDLASVEEEVYGDEEDWDDDEDFYEVECPKCGETIYLDDEAVEEGTFVCPTCGEEVEIEVDCDCDCDDDCDCDCGCGCEKE